MKEEMQEKQLSPEEKQSLAHWAAQAPPDEFANRVAASLHAPNKRRWMLAAITFAAMLSLLFWLWPQPTIKRGSIQANTRQEASLGGRATAVLEQGATLSWEVLPDHTARITQTQGDVFYRVEPGGSFIVKTDLGDVTVQGTCFRVEVEPMKELIIGGAIGAALSAIVTVSVYEGKVSVSNDKGAVSLVAGESAKIAPQQSPEKKEGPKERLKMDAPVLSAAPLAAPTNETSRDELLRRDEQMRQQIEMLQTKLQEIEKAGPKDELRNDWWFEPSQEELAQAAKDCLLSWDEPPDMDSPQQLANLSDVLNLTPTELDAMKKAQASVMEEYEEQLHALYAEVLGAAAPEDMSAKAMIQEMEAKSNQADIAMANYLITQERAGLKEPPKDLSSRPAIERALRLRVGIGDAFEAALAESIGDERAHALRGKGKGWPQRSMMAGGCNGLNEAK